MKKRYLFLAALLLLAALFVLTSCSDGTVSITKQPESMTVSYPDGASFSVEVKNPKNVQSYQWYEEDKVGNVFELKGVTAKTPKLIIPSTEFENDVLKFYCVITDKNGNQIQSDVALLDMDNREEEKPVFYVGEYAVQPGETLDLAEVDIGDGTKLGSGTVSYDANGTDITISNLDYDNTNMACDYVSAPNVGLSLLEYNPKGEEYNITFVGKNRINNTYFEPEYNAAGIPFDILFLGDEAAENAPVVNLIGDGTLEITNGTYALRAMGDLMVDIDITIRQSRKNYGDGLVARHMMIAEGHKLDLEVYGSALRASGNLFIKGSELLINANAPHISMGIAVKNILQSNLMVNIEDSKIDIHAYTDPDICAGIAGYTAIMANGEMYITNSDVSYSVEAKANDDVYASNFIGLAALNMDIDNSKVAISVDCEEIYSICGIYVDEYVLFEHSEADISLRASGMVYGIAPEGDFSSDCSKVAVDVGNYEKYGDYACFGIMCGDFAVKAAKPEQKVAVHAENGMAMGCNLGDPQDDPAEYQEGYQPQHFFLREGAECLSPADYTINYGNVDQGDASYRYYIIVETVYSRTDTSKPVQDVVFGIK